MSEPVYESDQKPGWCEEHNDLAWVYDDGSLGCYYTAVTESGSSECRAAPGHFEWRSEEGAG